MQETEAEVMIWDTDSISYSVLVVFSYIIAYIIVL